MYKKFKNLLVAYQGGGYDGCIWEWNFFYWDPGGKWHNLYSSGCGGVICEEKAIERYKDEDEDTDIYATDDEIDIKRFAVNFALPCVKAIVEKVSDILNCVEFYSTSVYPFCVCSECEEHVYWSEDEYWYTLLDFRGCGGIAVTAETGVCAECLENGICAECAFTMSLQEAYWGADFLDDDKLCEIHHNKNGWEMLVANKINEDTSDGKKLCELYRVVLKGERQLKEMIKRRPYDEVRLHRIHQNSVCKIEAEIEDLYEAYQESN